MRVLEMVEARVKSKAWKASVRDMAGPNLLQGHSEIPRRGGELLVVGSLQRKDSFIGCGRFLSVAESGSRGFSGVRITSFNPDLRIKPSAVLHNLKPRLEVNGVN